MAFTIPPLYLVLLVAVQNIHVNTKTVQFINNDLIFLQCRAVHGVLRLDDTKVQRYHMHSERNATEERHYLELLNTSSVHSEPRTSTEPIWKARPGRMQNPTMV
jgi:hypothetical protein